MTVKLSQKIALVLSSLLLFACTKKEANTTTPSNTATASAEKEYQVGIDAAYAPFGWVDNNQQVVGFDADIMAALAKEMKIKFKMVNTPWEGIFTQLNSGDRDILISAITVTDERKQSMDFSDPYFEAKQLIAVPTSSKVKSINDLKKLKVGVQTGTTGNDLTEKALGKDNTNIKRFESTPLALKELENGGVDAVVADNGVVINYVKNNGQKFKTVSDDSVQKEYYGIAIKKGNTDLQAKLNTALKAIRQNGTYDHIYENYFGKAQ